MYTSSRTFERTSLAAPVVACTTGMKTPSTSSVTSTEAIAAKLGIALRRIERSDSCRKKPSFIAASAVLAQDRAELGRRLRGVETGGLVAHDAALVQLDDAAAHAVDHGRVVRRDDDGRAGLVDAVQ